MGKIFYIMGKSSVGKDKIFKRLMRDKKLGLTKIVSYTTRPIRAKEKDGREYFFVSEERFKELETQGNIIESRCYDTVHGKWYYFLANDGQIKLKENNYLLIGTLEAYENVVKYFGGELIVPIYIEVDDGTRLKRALRRERKQAQPKYEEMCRRFLADAKDFSEENLSKAGIKKRFYNNGDLKDIVAEISGYISAEG